MTRKMFECDPKCPNVTRMHMSLAAVSECRAKREQGRVTRASALDTRAERTYDIAMTSDDNYVGAVVRDDLSAVAKWRPNFSRARLDMDVSHIEGAYLPGADFRGADSREFVPGVPSHMMTEARGAIVDDELVDEATQGARAWLLADVDKTPQTYDARMALDFVVPFLQWAFTNSQWEQLLREGYDPDELVEAAQEFPPRNERGFKAFMDSGDAVSSKSTFPDARSWGERELTLPPVSSAKMRQDRAARSTPRR